jgi:ribosomal subunit interface protein
MRTTIKATGSVELTPELRAFIEEKVAMLAKYIGSADNELAVCNVEVGLTTEGQQTGDIYRVEFNLEYQGSGVMRYVATAATLHKAIEKAKDEMKRELRRAREKEHDMFKRGATAIKRLFTGDPE